MKPYRKQKLTVAGAEEGAHGELSADPVAAAGALEVLENCVDVALKDVVSGHGVDGLMVGLDDVSALFQS